jgi:hypothetical protein
MAKKKKLIGDGDTFELEGLRFRARHVRDEGMGAPWKEHDGYGIVSDWTGREQAEGELVLAQDRSLHRFYDVDATLKKAREEGWGVAEEAAGKTKDEILALAVQHDYEHLKAWCDDEWYWMGVAVDMLDSEGNVLDRPDCHDALWGIESDSGDEYLDEVARECAGEIAARFKGKDEICIPIRKKEGK